MITINVIPKTREYAEYFRFELPFNGDITKTYSLAVIGSNLPAPKLIEFTTKVVNNIPQNYAVLEFEGRCNNTQMTLEFRTQAEAVEKKKVAFMTWLMSYLTWLNPIFRILSLKTLKKITAVIAGIILVPVIGGMIYAAVDWSYELIYDESFDDSKIVQIVDDFRFRKIGNYFREDALDDAKEIGEFSKDKLDGAIEATKEKAEDIKEAVEDTIDDIKD